MPLKEGGKGHQQSYDPTTGKYGSGKSDFDDKEIEKDTKEIDNDDEKMKQESEKVENSKQEDIKPIDLLAKLINEEIDAIKSYTSALRVFKKIDNKEIVDRLIEIRADELEHKEELESLKDKF